MNENLRLMVMPKRRETLILGVGPGSSDYRQAGLQSSAGEGGSRSWGDQERLYDENGARAEPRAVNQIMKRSTGGLVG